jgi:hypothetical protein
LSKKQIGELKKKKNLTTDFYSLIHVKIKDRTMRGKKGRKIKIEVHRPFRIEG